MKVNTEGLENAANVLLRLSYQMADIQASVHQATRRLTRESVGERFHPALMRSIQDMACCGRDLAVLHSALKDIARTYERSELRILEETEHAPPYIEPRFWRAVRVPGVADLTVQEAPARLDVEPFLEDMFYVRNDTDDRAVIEPPGFAGGIDIQAERAELQSIIDSVAQTVADAFGEDNTGAGENGDFFPGISEETGPFEIDWTPWEP